METVPSDETECLPLEFNKITEYFQKKAEIELYETEEEKVQCLQNLKEKLENVENLYADTRKEILIQFLRARKFDVEAAFDLVIKFYKHKKAYPTIYKPFNSSKLTDLIKTKFIYFLPKRSPEGCAILLTQIAKWNPRLFTYGEINQYALMCTTYQLLNPVTQIAGIASLIDMKGFSISHLINTSFLDVRCMVSSIQDSLPMRHKAIHIVNNSSLFSALFSIVRPLLKEKLRHRIMLHGTSMDSLHKYLPPSILPEEYGGILSHSTDEFGKKLLSDQEQIAASQQFGYT